MNARGDGVMVIGPGQSTRTRIEERNRRRDGLHNVGGASENSSDEEESEDEKEDDDDEDDEDDATEESEEEDNRVWSIDGVWTMKSCESINMVTAVGFSLPSDSEYSMEIVTTRDTRYTAICTSRSIHSHREPLFKTPLSIRFSFDSGIWYLVWWSMIRV